MDEIARIGDNKPPSQIVFTQETGTILGAWLKDHPVVDTEEVARSGKLLVDRARLCLQDLEGERTAQTKSLNEQIKVINETYRSPRAVLDKLLGELKARLDVWLKAEEYKRLREAEETRRRAEELEAKAREAEAREREAAEDARVGVESDIGTATQDADAAFSEYQKAEREAKRAERAVDVKLPGGFRRALYLKDHETLIVVDADQALEHMGWSERMIEALLKDAREFRRQHGKLPNGISSKEERKI